MIGGMISGELFPGVVFVGKSATLCTCGKILAVFFRSPYVSDLFKDFAYVFLRWRRHDSFATGTYRS